MKRDLVDILACPACRGGLALSVDAEADGEIVEGGLRCAACAEVYPIAGGIPNLLPPELRAAVSEDGGAS